MFKGNPRELELVTGVDTVATGAGSEVEEVRGAEMTGGEVGGGISTVAFAGAGSVDGVSGAWVAGVRRGRKGEGGKQRLDFVVYRRFEWRIERTSSPLNK